MTDSRPAADVERGAIWPAIARGWPVVLGIALLAVATSLFVASRREVRYEATARLLVKPLPQYEPDFFGTNLIRDAGDAARTPQTVARVLESNEVAAATAAGLGGGWTRRSVLDAVTVEPEGDSNVIAVTAVSDDRNESARVATSFARSAIDLRRRALAGQLRRRLAMLEERRSRLPEDDYSRRDNLDQEIRAIEGALEGGGDPTLTLADAATPGIPVRGAPVWSLAGIALLGGLLLGAAAAVALERLRRSLGTEAELLAVYPLPVLGRVPTVRGHTGAVPPFAFPAEGRHAFRGLARQLTRLRPSGRTVLVTSAARGDGRTTATASLGLAMGEAGHSVVLVDLDDGYGELDELTAEPRARGTLRLERGDVFGERPVSDVLNKARVPGVWVLVDAPPVLEGGTGLGAAAEADDIVFVARLGHTPRRHLATARQLLKWGGAEPIGMILMAAGDTRVVPGRRLRRSREGPPAPELAEEVRSVETTLASTGLRARRSWRRASLLLLALAAAAALLGAWRIERSHAASTSIPVLLYHGIGTSAGEVRPQAFDAQMRYLRARGYRSIDTGRYRAWLRGRRTRLPRRPILITFDDGMASAASATTMLAAKGLRATMFVATGFASRSVADYGHFYLTWDELRSLDRRVWSFAFHAGEHGHDEFPHLECPWYYPCVHPGETRRDHRQRVVRDIDDGIQTLARELPGADVRSFAVPWNQYGQRVTTHTAHPSNDPLAEAFLLRTFAARFHVVFVQDRSAGHARRYCFEITPETNLATLKRFLADRAFARARPRGRSRG